MKLFSIFLLVISLGGCATTDKYNLDANIPENERCDQLAVKASQGEHLLIDEDYEK